MNTCFEIGSWKRVPVLAAFAAGLLLSSIIVRGDVPKGRIVHDLKTGAKNDVELKADQIVQVMKNTGTRAVIMVQLPDGSNGVFQIDAADVEMIAPPPLTPTPPPTPPPAATSVATDAPATNVVAATGSVINLAPTVPIVSAIKPAAPPSYPNDFVGGAEVTTTLGTYGAGAAAVVKLSEGAQAYVLSARHLLGPQGGFGKETPASEVPSLVKSIKIYAFKGDGQRSYNITPLLVNSTRLAPIGGEPIDDLTIYKLKDSSLQKQAIELADKIPDKDAPVYLIAHVTGGVPEGQRVHPMKVFETRTWLECVFDNDQTQTSGASGAPVLNAEGKCVGIYSAHNTVDGHKHAFIVPSPLIISVIKSQAK